MNMIDIIEGCSRKKWKIKKQEQKFNIIPIKKSCKKDLESFI